MTPTEMRQQAVRSRSRAGGFDASAARLRVIADQIRPLLSDLPSRSRDVWVGPAASDFEQRVAEADAEVEAQAALLVATAVEFESEARRLRSEATSLDAQAAAAEAVAAVSPPGGLGGPLVPAAME